MLSERRPLDNMSRFLLKLDLAVFPDLAFFGFLILRLYLQEKAQRSQKTFSMYWISSFSLLFASTLD